MFNAHLPANNFTYMYASLVRLYISFLSLKTTILYTLAGFDLTSHELNSLQDQETIPLHIPRRQVNGFDFGDTFFQH
jgi:hypothetical protein